MTMKLGVFVTCVAFMVTELVAEPIVVEHPQNVTVFVGDPFSMSCVFNDTVNGAWNYKAKGGNGFGDELLLQAVGQITNPNTKFFFVINATHEGLDGTWSCFDLDRPEIKSSEAYVTVKSGEICVPPASVGFFEGQEVELNCRLTFPAICTWLKDDDVVVIGHHPRVEYLQNNGIDNHDCSIRISEAREIDEGNWTCVASHNNFWHRKSSPASVYLNSITALVAEPEVIEGPWDDVVFFGDPFSLRCVFSETVNGTWNLKTSFYSGVDLYDKISSPPPRTDFSLMIDHATEKHNGFWWCSDSDRPRIKSSVAHITVKHRKIIVPPANVTVIQGQELALTCRLTFPGNCTWLKDGDIVSAGHHLPVKYLLDNGTHTQDCSIRISEARESDEGDWMCIASYSDVGRLESFPASVKVNSITAPWLPSLWFYVGLTTVLITTIIELSVCAWCCCHKLRKQRPTFQGTSRRMGSCSCETSPNGPPAGPVKNGPV